MNYSRARGRLPSELDGLLASQLKNAIEEAHLGAVDSQIAYLYMIDRLPQIDIADELRIERKTVSRRLKAVSPSISAAAQKLKQ